MRNKWKIVRKTGIMQTYSRAFGENSIKYGVYKVYDQMKG